MNGSFAVVPSNVGSGPVAPVATTVAIDQYEPSRATGNGGLIY